MSSSSSGPPPGGDEPASNGRLDSWKEIAAYLRRSVRSAKRWEKEEQLPVRRHMHGKRDSIYAYKPELDDWWSNRGAKLRDENGAKEIAPEVIAPASDEPQAIALAATVGEPEPVEKAPVLPKKTRTAALFSIGLFLALLVVAAWLSNRNSGHASGPPLPFKVRDWVLVTSFENRTGRPILDGTLDYALQRELSNSRHVNVVPRERIGDVLRLMRKPEETRIDAALGREICLRDGDIRALITGRIERLGSKYLLSVELVDPSQGASIASVAEEAARDEELLPATRRISDRFRAMLGENLPSIHEGKANLLKVTTPSLHALQLYSRADALIAQGDSAAAEELLKQAVAEDPEFASAHIHLAWAIGNQHRPAEEWRPYAEAAFRLSATTTERERYFIRGSYYQLLDQPEKAIAAFRALFSLYPDHFWGAQNLIALYMKQGQLKDAAEMELRRADLRPKDFEANYDAAVEMLAFDPARSGIYLRRARGCS
jgi:tetratricopeptide (TPR) repeat protein